MRLRSLTGVLGLIMAAMSVMAVSTAWSADQGPKLSLNITMQKEVRTQKEGKDTVELVTADKVSPYDVVLYTIEYKNEGAGEARDAKIVDPIPRETAFIVGSAKGDGADISFSVDGGKTYHRPPVKVTVTREDGKKEEIDAPPESYTHIKWVITKRLQPGETGKASFRATVK